MGVCDCSMFCCMLLYVHSSIAIILMGKRELVALLNLSSCCLWWLSGSSSRCHGVVCGLWLWYFLIILTYYFCMELITTCGCKKCAAPSDVNVEGWSDLHDRMCIWCSGMCLSYRTASCPGGLQLWELKEFNFCLYHAVWVLNMLNHNPVCRYLGYLRIWVYNYI